MLTNNIIPQTVVTMSVQRQVQGYGEPIGEVNAYLFFLAMLSILGVALLLTVLTSEDMTKRD